MKLLAQLSATLIACGLAAQIPQQDVVVVGGGLTGATTAYYLKRGGKDVVLTEASEHVGGMVNSKGGGGFLWEEGPNSFKPTPEIVKLAMDLGVEQELIYADGNAPRFVYVDGKRHSIPLSIWGAITTGIISTGGKFRALAGLLGFVSRTPSGKDESVDEFVTRHLGSEVMQKMMDPFLSGVYAGDAKRLSMKSTFPKLHKLGKGGGLLYGMLTSKSKQRRMNPADNTTLPVVKGLSLGSFRNGIQTVPTAIRHYLDSNLATGHELEAVRRIDGGFELKFRCSNKLGPVTMRCKQLVLAAPAQVSGRLLQTIVPQARLLQQVYYPTITAVIVAYPKDAFREPLKGFGHLIPRSTGIRSLGTIYCSALFPGRAPEGYELLLSFIGGAQDPVAASVPQDQLVQIADRDLREILLRPDAAAPQVIAVRTFQRSIPQFEIGFNEIMDQATSAINLIPGLYMTGNFKSGVAVGDCIAAGMETAADVMRETAAAGSTR